MTYSSFIEIIGSAIRNSDLRELINSSLVAARNNRCTIGESISAFMAILISGIKLFVGDANESMDILMRSVSEQHREIIMALPGSLGSEVPANVDRFLKDLEKEVPNHATRFLVAMSALTYLLSLVAQSEQPKNKTQLN